MGAITSLQIDVASRSLGPLKSTLTKKRADQINDQSPLLRGHLSVLRDHIADESVDLIYLDPPFNSNASYNVLFRGPRGNESPAQIEAFDDTWTWNDLTSGKALEEVKESPYQDAAAMLDAMVGFLGKNAMTAYLCMMGVRLTVLHRVLKPTGSLYLHCDPTASHYLKVLLDAVFGARNFMTEIVWKRTRRHP